MSHLSECARSKWRSESSQKAVWSEFWAGLTAMTLQGKHGADKAGLSLVASHPLKIVTFQTNICHICVWKFFVHRSNRIPSPLNALFWFSAVSGGSPDLRRAVETPPGVTPSVPPRPVPTCSPVCPGLLSNCRIPSRWIFPPPCLCFCGVLFPGCLSQPCLPGELLFLGCSLLSTFSELLPHSWSGRRKLTTVYGSLWLGTAHITDPRFLACIFSTLDNRRRGWVRTSLSPAPSTGSGTC